MNKIVLNFGWTTILSLFFLVLCGCKDDADDNKITIKSNKVCTEWGAMDFEVMDYMRSYDVRSSESDFICFWGNDNVEAISYQFNDGKLYASLVLIKEENISADELKSIFSKYEYFGEKDGTDVYVNKSDNIMASIYKRTRNGDAYYAIGYTALEYTY